MATWERVDDGNLPVYYDIEAWAQWPGVSDGGWIAIGFSPDNVEGAEPLLV